MRRQHTAQVKRHILKMIPQPSFVESADRPSGKTGSHQQNEQAGPFKECPEVEANTAEVNQVTQNHRGSQSQHRA